MNTDRIDIVAGAKALRQTLKEHNFTERDADGSDFQFGTDPSLRFKVGTVKGEVTLTVWKHARCVETIRVLTDEQVVEAKHRIDSLVHDFFAKNHEWKAE